MRQRRVAVVEVLFCARAAMAGIVSPAAKAVITVRRDGMLARLVVASAFVNIVSERLKRLFPQQSSCCHSGVAKRNP
jgi:hypothetical protein